MAECFPETLRWWSVEKVCQGVMWFEFYEVDVAQYKSLPLPKD